MRDAPLTYADAGVNIDNGNRSVDLIRSHVERTRRPEVLSGLGGFGGLFALKLADYQEPVLVSGTDGVGTKLRLAIESGVLDTIGIDAVAMCVNDILVSGAEPLFFLDYLALGELVPEEVEQIVKGVADGCEQAHCALIGGETAEMPGVYPPGDFDIAGFSVGIVDKANLIDGSTIKPDDLLVGLSSTGLHSNGYSLARKVFFEKAGLGLDDTLPELNGRPLKDVLLAPTRIYVPMVLPLIKKLGARLKGMVHITGGGFQDNIPRVLPDGVEAVIDRRNWTPPAIFSALQRLGNIDRDEMYRTFNMGVGFVLVVSPAALPTIERVMKDFDVTVTTIGTIKAKDGKPAVRFEELACSY